MRLSEKKSSRSKNQKKIRWDYSDVPRKEWWWDVGEYNSYTVIAVKEGLRYSVDDFWDSHGAGFQPYSDFFKKGPINNMPKAIEDEIKAYILQFRREGGSRMSGDLEVKSSEIKPWRVFVSLNGPSISIITEPTAARNNPLDLFKGDFPPGSHLLSWAIVFDILKPEKSKWIVYGKSRIELSPGDHDLHLQAGFIGKGKELIKIKAYMDEKLLDIFDKDQFAYFG